MSENPAPKVVIWPFLLMDLVFFGLAYVLFHFGNRPLLLWEAYAIILCVTLGAWTFLQPFRTKLRIAESENLLSAAEEIKKIEHIANQISSSTSLWHSIQEQAGKTATDSKMIADQIAQEASSFTEFLQRANDSEKSHLRLENEKLKRSESEWLEMLVRISDHIFALHHGAKRSGQPRLVEQISNFQNACADVTRRVGLNSFTPDVDEPFDPQIHHLRNGETADESSQISETLACGYTFRGQLLRPALVSLKTNALPSTSATPSEPAETHGELPLA